MNLTLACVFVQDDFQPAGNVFLVQISPSDLLVALINKIYEIHLDTMRRRNLQVNSLQLWKPSFALPSNWDGLNSELSLLPLDQMSGEGANKKVVQLDPLATVEEVFLVPLPRKCVHLLVKFPPPEQLPESPSARILGKRAIGE
jgi:hypothetical protein